MSSNFLEILSLLMLSRKNTGIKLPFYQQFYLKDFIFRISRFLEVQFDGIIGNKSEKSANLWQSSIEFPGVC